jgi:hypothetical protein
LAEHGHTLRPQLQFFVVTRKPLGSLKNQGLIMKLILNPLTRSLLAASGLVASSLFVGGGTAYASPATDDAQHHTRDDASVPTMTTPLAVTGGRDINLLRDPGVFNPSWFGNALDYTANYDFSQARQGGTLWLTQASTVTYTLVGFEASFNNAFVSGSERLNNRTGEVANLGDSFSFSTLSAGVLDFGFLAKGRGDLSGNGSRATGLMLAKDHQSALIVFNDHSGRDRDYDDMVIRVSLAAAQVSPVPEPGTTAMLLAGVGLLGLARRRARLA